MTFYTNMAATTALRYTAGFQIGRLNVALEVYALRCWRMWGITRLDAASIACDLGVISVVISKEGTAAAYKCSGKPKKA